MSYVRHCLLITLWWLATSAGAGGAERFASAMETDPAFPLRATVHTAPERLLPLWLEAIAADDAESDVVSQVAGGIVRMRRLGISVEESLGGQVIDQLALQLQRPELDDGARLAIAHALTEFNARRHAKLLAAQLAGGGRDMAEIVEPALARWRDATIRDQWLARLQDPHAPPQLLRLAIQAVGIIEEPTAAESLTQLAINPRQSPAVRIEAAKSLAALQSGGLEAHARNLLASAEGEKPVAQLVAAYMLGRHVGREAEELLAQLADAQEPAVAAAALARLTELNPSLVHQRRARLLASADAKLRLLGVRIVRERPAPDGVELLGDMLGDGHLDVRRAVGAALVELASQPSRRDEIIAVAVDRLDAEAPAQTEQALRVLAALNAEQAGPQILELLNADDPIASVTAAWALESLATPQLAEQVQLRVVQDIDRTVAAVKELAPLYQREANPSVELPDLNAVYDRVEHLILALGQARRQEAESLLLRFVPKPNRQAGDPPLLEAFHQPRPRAAAIWSLGKIYAGRGDEAPAELLNSLAERLTDATPIPREEPLVRSMAAISLGRIGAPSSQAALQETYKGVTADDDLGRACCWALERLSGMPSASVGARVVHHADWFLVPID